ncbi:TPA: ead/Ea22-like family protein [Burkholderia vietnamiensis]|uniref:ead/Ea22-like family protein n=1 Tax=Burkholderia vietnamiensis TaxID=60552 RepID=UPI001592F4DB|nr:ead/Ea22-like family protein [Burkholderia vietnamiensis]MDN7819429.1 ead/Ea22-like family protein [Burkholderia vietnamiensis]HDR9011045.1 ead/Ea22-like family protein [Burkholderia vietnamiensis]HDR9016370.1 ead/Ea22-like family protein [Burkholderia vietnamiensis]
MENITSNYDALQAAAEKATKGNWINVGAWVENERDDLKDICDCRPNGTEDYDQALRDATYIALANPDTILRLLLERRTASTIAGPCDLPPAAIDVLMERRRQIAEKGWTADRDDGYVCGEIAALAAHYAMPPSVRDWPAADTGYGATFGQAILPEGWSAKIGDDRRRELVKAGALILAEIERIDRDPGDESHHDHLNGGSL